MKRLLNVNHWGPLKFDENCLSSSFEGEMMVRIGNIKASRAENGWHPAHTVCFKNGRVSEIYFQPEIGQGLVDATKVEKITLIP